MKLFKFVDNIIPPLLFHGRAFNTFKGVSNPFFSFKLFRWKWNLYEILYFIQGFLSVEKFVNRGPNNRT